MPQLLTRLTRQLASKGVKGAKGMATALLKKRGHLSPTGELTSAGKKRQALGNDGRAKDRAVKQSGGKPSDYKYNPKTNRTSKK